ncbi:hypothetical protein [Paludibaculum fermentans]|uniref:RCC1 domain-containing protein n=1 Tax=Paludibaculum fermentans TaxID=1473598 RepID=UPI003EBFB70B
MKIFLPVFRGMAGRLMLSALTGWLSLAAPIWGAERVYLLERQAQGSALYSFRSIGEIEGARRAAVPETGGHVLVLTSLGRVWGWGQNLHGQLGTGDRAAKAGFIEVSGLSGITAIDAGAQHSVALQGDGTVWTWGANTEGQLGDGSLVNRARPGVVPGLRDVSMIAAGALFTVALKSDGSVWAFGSNWNGIAPGDARKMVTEPVVVEGLNGVRAVAVRRGIGYAFDGQGRIWVWGRGVENAAGAPRMLSETERGLALGLMSTGPRMSAEWLGTGIDAAEGVLRMRESRASRTFAMEGTALDVAAGWAVALITGSPETARARESGVAAAAAIRPAMAVAGVALAVEGQRKGVNAAAAVQVSAAGHSTMVLRPDGTVLGWGDNDSGQLGSGTLIGRFTSQCTEFRGMRSIAAGRTHSLAIAQDGTVWSSGQGSNGALGDGDVSTRYQLVPKQVPGLSGVTAAAAGAHFSLALKSDGTVWAWGANNLGQLGDGTNTDRGVPQQVPGLAGITSIAAGNGHALARRSDGAVFAWGLNGQGQLGDGGTTNRNTPGQMASFTSESVAAGEYHSLAIRSDRTLWGWGYNATSAIKEGAGTTILSPVQAPGISDVVFAAGSYEMTGVQKADGSVWFWGGSFTLPYGGGQKLGPTPTTLNAPAGVSGFALGWGHIVLLLQDGTVMAWGSNEGGQLGPQSIGSSAQFVESKLESPCAYEAPKPLDTDGRLAAGSGFSVVRQEDGTVSTSGKNDYGQLGDGTTNATGMRGPVQVPGLTGITKVSAGFGHTLALASDGRVFGWGLNSQSQLASDLNHLVEPSPIVIRGLSDVVDVAAGNAHSLAVRRDGTVWAWGSNGQGESGSWSPGRIFSPLQVEGLQDVVAVSAGVQFSVALKRDGTVWAWGSDSTGQVGQNPGGSSYTPKPVAGLSDVIAISSGATFSSALKRDGTVWSWGDGQDGQLGIGVRTQAVRGIARVAGLTNVVAVKAGAIYGLAMKADGTVWSWGWNSRGELGNGTGIESLRPAQVPGFQGAASIGAGGQSLAWKRDGRIWAWGANDYGQLGVTNVAGSVSPILTGFQQGYLLPVTPVSATAVPPNVSARDFEFQFHSAAGLPALQWAQMLFAAAPDGGGQPFCYLHYDVPGQGLWLYGDEGFFLGPVAPGSAAELLQNSFCALNPQATSVTASGSNVTIQAQLLFKAVGSQKILLRSHGANDEDSGWIESGTWNSTAAAATTMSVNPSSGSGAGGTFQAGFFNAVLPPVLTGTWVQLLVAAAPDGGGHPFCYLHYDRAGDGLWMYSGDVGFFLGPVKPGVSSTVLDSSACSINTAGTTVQNNAGQLVISAPFTLKSPMAGSKKIFQRSMDALRRDTGWVQTGTWTIP